MNNWQQAYPYFPYDPTDEFSNWQERAPQQSYLRVVHASPDAPPVDVYLDNKKVLSHVSFKQASAYLPVSAGHHQVTIYLAGQQTNPVINQRIMVQPGTAYTIAAIGKLNQIHLFQMVDQPTNHTGTTRIRIGHFSPDAPPIEIVNQQGHILFRSIPFRGITDYISVPPGPLNLTVRVAGTGNPILNLNHLNLRQGETYSLFIVGSAHGTPPLQPLLLMDQLTHPEPRYY